MATKVAFKAVLIWLGILALAVANGLLREAVLIAWLGTPAAPMLSGLLLSALIIGVAYLSVPWLGISRSGALCLVGLGWFALTLIFEISFGLFQGKSRSELFDAYTFNDGNLWPVVLATVALAPYIAAKLRKW